MTLSACVHLLFRKIFFAHAIPRDRKHEQTNFSPLHQSSTVHGLLVWSVPQLPGSQTSGSPVPRIATAAVFSSAHLTMSRDVPGLILPLDATNDLVDAVAFIDIRLLVESLCHD